MLELIWGREEGAINRELPESGSLFRHELHEFARMLRFGPMAGLESLRPARRFSKHRRPSRSAFRNLHLGQIFGSVLIWIYEGT